MKYAQIRDGKVFRVDDFDEEPNFASNIEMVPCGGDVGQNWIYTGSIFIEPSPEDNPRPITKYVDFIEMIGEDAYDAIMNSNNKKARWIREIWSIRGKVNANNPHEIDALNLMLSIGLITPEVHGELVGL